MINQNFDLMSQGLNVPKTPVIEPLKRPSFGPAEVSDGFVDPMLSNRTIEEPAVKAYECQKRPRFNADNDWMKGSKLYEQFGLAADQRQKPTFNQQPADS